MNPESLRAHRIVEPFEPATVSEDFGVFGRAAGAPSVVFVGARAPRRSRRAPRLR